VIRTLLKLTAFTAVCMVFTLWLGFTIGNIEPLEDRYSLSASFDDVTGLLVNDNVKVAGVPVGKVTGIKVVRGEAVVDFEVDKGVRLPSDTATAVRWRNLLGQRYLYLYPGDSPSLLEADDAIPLRQSLPIVDIGELFNRLGPIVQAIDPEQANEFMEAVTGALEGGNDAALGQTIADFGTVVRSLATRDESIGRLVENLAELTDAVASRDRQLRTILDNTTALAETFNEHTDVVEATVDDLGRYSELLGRLIADNRPGIDRIIVRLNDVVNVVGGRLETFDSTVAGLDDLGLSLYNAARYGEWLNQWIACTVIDPDGPDGPIPPFESTDHCEGEAASASGGGANARAARTNPVEDVLGALAGAVAPPEAGGAG